MHSVAKETNTATTINRNHDHCRDPVDRLALRCCRLHLLATLGEDIRRGPTSRDCDTHMDEVKVVQMIADDGNQLNDEVDPADPVPITHAEGLCIPRNPRVLVGQVRYHKPPPSAPPSPPLVTTAKPRPMML